MNKASRDFIDLFSTITKGNGESKVKGYEESRRLEDMEKLKAFMALMEKIDNNIGSKVGITP